MGADHDETLQNIEEWIEMLLQDLSDWLIIVEGKKDILALKNLGIDIDAVPLNKGFSNLDLLERIWRGDGEFDRFGDKKGIVILTDWDRTGGRLARSLGEKCRFLGIPFDLGKRRDLARITGKWVRDVESLDTFYLTLKEGRSPSLT
jgi:5S rRNA maturation endonuclease (ribonuclease M5)